MNHRGLCGKFIFKKFKRGRVPWRKNNPRGTQLLSRNFFFLNIYKPRRSTSHRYITSSLHLRVESMYTENSKYLPLATFHSIVKLLLTIPHISVLRAFSYHLTASPDSDGDVCVSKGKAHVLLLPLSGSE